MIPLIVAIVIVPWVAVVAVILAVLHHAAVIGVRIDALTHPRPCPLCLAEDALVDPDGVALCTECHCSFEVTAL